MDSEHRQFISEDSEELRRIKEKKLNELTRLQEKRQEMSGKPVPLTDSDFTETVNKHTLALIDCWAPWCSPCIIISPIVEELARKYAGKVLFGKLNVDDSPMTAGRFQIFGIPTLLIIKNGREVDRIVGLVPKEHVEARLKKHLE
jgi:thioredoxin 1